MKDGGSFQNNWFCCHFISTLHIKRECVPSNELVWIEIADISSLDVITSRDRVSAISSVYASLVK